MDSQSTLSKRRRAQLLLNSCCAAALVLVATGCGGGGSKNGTVQLLLIPRPTTVFAVGVSSTPFVPEGTAKQYTIMPELPAGLIFDETTGAISGTPEASLPLTTFTITAVFGNGKDISADVDLEIVDPSRFLLAGNATDNSIGTYLMNADTGSLTSISHITAAIELNDQAIVHPTLPVLYLPDPQNDAIAAFSFDPTNGQMLPKPSITTGDQPVDMLLGLDGSQAWVLSAGSGEISTLNIESPTGNLIPNTSVVPLATSPGAAKLMLHPNGEHLFVINADNYTIQCVSILTDGSLTAVGEPLATLEEPDSIAIQRDGSRIFVGNRAGGALSTYGFDNEVGELELLSHNVVRPLQPEALHLDPSGRFLYVLDGFYGSLNVFDVNATDGSITPRDEKLDLGGKVSRMNVDSTGRYAYVACPSQNEVKVCELDTNSGDMLLVNSFRTRGEPIFARLVNGKSPARQRADYVFISNASSQDLSIFDVDEETEDLISIGASASAGGTPTEMVVGPMGEFAYAIESDTNTVSSFYISADRGTLSLMDTATTGQNPVDLAIDGSGQFLYVINQDDETISTFEVDRSNGNLSPAAQATLDVFTRPVSIAADPVGRYLFVGTAGDNQDLRTIAPFSIDSNDGSLTAGTAQGSGGIPADLAVHPSGRFVYAALENTQIAGMYVVQPDGEILPLLGRLAGSIPTSVSVDPTGQFLYVGNAESNDITMYGIDPLTGVHFIIGEQVIGMNPIALNANPSGELLYALNQTDATLSSLNIDPVTGLLTPAADFPTNSNPGAVASRRLIQ